MRYQSIMRNIACLFRVFAQSVGRLLKKSLRHHLHERSLIFQFIKDHSKQWTIEMMCRVLGVSRSKLSRKFRVTTDASHGYNVAPNLLNREFNQEEPVKACVSDITYLSCKDGFLYLTCVIDLFDRKLIGWSISDNLTASGTVIPAIRMANRNRPFKEGMIVHSDRGIQYACKQTVNLLEYYKGRTKHERERQLLG